MNGGAPIVNRGVYDSGHTVVHDDGVAGAESATLTNGRMTRGKALSLTRSDS